MRLPIALSLSLLAGTVSAQTEVIDFEDLPEGFYGENFFHAGILFGNINQVSGSFPTGETFGPQPGENVVIEDGTFFYDAFPGWGSADKMMTFGIALVPGDNLSLGRVSSVTMELGGEVNFASMDIGFFENGPWGGIVIRMDAIRQGVVVTSTSRTLSDLGGRDSSNVDTLTISGSRFDTIHLYATFGEEFSLPRVVIDDLTLNRIASCPADVNSDGVLSPADFSAWIAAFNSGSPLCNQNGDRECSPADFSAWIANFNAGC